MLKINKTRERGKAMKEILKKCGEKPLDNFFFLCLMNALYLGGIVLFSYVKLELAIFLASYASKWANFLTVGLIVIFLQFLIALIRDGMKNDKNQ